MNLDMEKIAWSILKRFFFLENFKIPITNRAQEFIGLSGIIKYNRIENFVKVYKKKDT